MGKANNRCRHSATTSPEKAIYRVSSELGGIEMLDAKYHYQNFSRHSHEGFTFGVIENGAQEFYRTGANHVAPQGSIIIVNADEVHTGHSATEGGWSYQAMYPLPEQLERIARELNPSLTAKGSVIPYFAQPVVYDLQLANQFRLVFDSFKTSDNRLLKETLLYAVLTRIMSKYGKLAYSSAPVIKAQRQLKLVKEFIDDFPSADVSLQELANLAALSPFYLVRSFQKAYGFAPHSYQIQARLRLAKKLLKQGGKISEVAQQAGFHDQSHLHRHFKRAMGVTPGEFAKQVIKQ